MGRHPRGPDRRRTTRRRSKSRTTIRTRRTSRRSARRSPRRGSRSIEGWADTTARVDTLATLSRRRCSEILKALMKPSQNQIAEMLFRTVALEARSRRATARGRSSSARSRRGAWRFRRRPIVRDGSGLARYDYISPRTVVRILDAMRRSPNFQVFYDALPIGGVDGTIRNRMKGTPAEGNVHAKTGSVALVAIAVRLRDDGRSAHADLQLPVEQLDGAGAVRRDASRTRSPRASPACGCASDRGVQRSGGERAHSRRRFARSARSAFRCATRSAACSASDVRSPIEHPPWDNSSMDGYAVRAADVAAASASSPVVLARRSRRCAPVSVRRRRSGPGRQFAS